MSEKWEFYFDEEDNFIGATYISSVNFTPEEIPLEVIEKQCEQIGRQLEDIHDTAEYRSLDKKGESLLRLRDKLYEMKQ